MMVHRGFLGLAVAAALPLLVGAGSVWAAATPSSKKVSREPRKIAKWRASALEGDPIAQYNLALAYLDDPAFPAPATVEKNNETAVSWMSRAAEQDYEPAMYYLGIFYTGSFGVQSDHAQSRCWFERSARRAYPRGYYALGRIYYEGIGTERDLVRAHAFLTLGQVMGHQPSTELLQTVMNELVRQDPELMFVRKSMEFINSWGAKGTPLPQCRVPGKSDEQVGE